MVKKKGGKINCGECKNFFDEEALIADFKNNRYLCDGCYEPRDEDKDIDRDPDHEEDRCGRCDNLREDCECDRDDGDDNIDYDKEESPRVLRGEARITHDARERQPRESKKSLIW